MSDELMNTKEVADYIGVHEKQIYALIKSKKIPCTRVTGKWIFPKNAIDRWIIESTEVPVNTSVRDTAENILLASGSNDPVLEFLINYMKQIYPLLRIFSSSTGSSEGLNLLKNGITDIAWCHLYDPQSGEYNIPVIADTFNSMRITIVHLFYRELGFISSKGRNKEITSFSDLTQPGLKFVNRQGGSGTRILIDHNLQKEGISPESITGYYREVFTHLEVGLDILSGESDVGVATVAVANLFGLPFTPIVKESFDMVLHQDTFFKKEVQAFIDAINTDDFKKRVYQLGNYDFSNSGKILYSTTE